MKTFLFDLDDTIIHLNWGVFEKAYYGGLAEAFSHLMPKEAVGKYVYLSYVYMVQVVDGRTNKEKFYDKMSELCGIDKEILKKEEPGYYLNKYDELKGITKPIDAMVESVNILKEKGYPLVIASNPVFPAIATLKRLSWIGFTEDDFVKVTYFETQYACKPQMQFYTDLLKQLNLKPEDCVMVGNDRKEDMMATLLGVQGILITDYLFDSDDDYICKEMTSQEFLSYVKEL